MFCTRARSCVRADDPKIACSRNAQRKTRESPKTNNISWCEMQLYKVVKTCLFYIYIYSLKDYTPYFAHIVIVITLGNSRTVLGTVVCL